MSERERRLYVCVMPTSFRKLHFFFASMQFVHDAQSFAAVALQSEIIAFVKSWKRWDVWRSHWNYSNTNCVLTDQQKSTHDFPLTFFQVETATKHALITDFGISRLAGHSPSDTMTSVTKAYSTAANGTLTYMAPELLEPNERGLFNKPNFQSDVFALGGTLAELLSSRRLYGDDCRTMAMLLSRKAQVTVPYAATYVPELYRDLLRRSLAQNPRGRPSARDLAQSIGGYFGEWIFILAIQGKVSRF